MIDPPENTLLSMSWPRWFVPRGNCPLGGLNLGPMFMADGSYGEIQGASKVIKTMEITIPDPMTVIQPARPLLVNVAKAGKRLARMLRLVSTIDLSYNRILGSRYAYRTSTTRLTRATRSPKKTTAP